MTGLRSFVTSGAACLAIATLIAASPAAGARQAVRMASVVGCLTEGAVPAAWTLTRATDGTFSDQSDAVVTPQPGTSAELTAALSQPLGTFTYRLLGTTQLNMQGMKDHKVLAKGLLIQTDNERRLNVTSLQAIATSCAPDGTDPDRPN